jgi:hypothetical protein
MLESVDYRHKEETIPAGKYEKYFGGKLLARLPLSENNRAYIFKVYG